MLKHQEQTEVLAGLLSQTALARMALSGSWLLRWRNPTRSCRGDAVSSTSSKRPPARCADSAGATTRHAHTQSA